MEIRALTVSQLNNYLKRVLKNDPLLNSIKVEGEISNLKKHKNGHFYFSLKDQRSKINCVMFKDEAQKIKFNLENGLNVVVTGYVSIYEKDGIYQLYAKDISPIGIGELYLAFEQLKKRLEKEGWFDKERKKRLPYLPKKIGVVTSATGAAIRDIIKVIKRRFPLTNIVLYPVLVQGGKAAYEISKAVNYFNTREDIDVIIVGRGGGSIEELWAFNEEIVAKAIYNSKIPVVSAVGHETDFTISDYVADLRAPTPSAAAELVVPDINELKERLFLRYKRLLKSYENYVKNKLVLLRTYKLEILRNRLMERIIILKQKANYTYKELLNYCNDYVKDNLNYLNFLYEKLCNMNPQMILKRGYAIPLKQDGKVIKNINEVNENDILDIIIGNGILKVKVLEKHKSI